MSLNLMLTEASFLPNLIDSLCLDTYTSRYGDSYANTTDYFYPLPEFHLGGAAAPPP